MDFGTTLLELDFGGSGVLNVPLPVPLPVPASGCGDACRRLDVIAKRLPLRPVRATRRPLGRWPEMPLDHHRLDVYRRALALLEDATES